MHAAMGLTSMKVENAPPSARVPCQESCTEGVQCPSIGLSKA